LDGQQPVDERRYRFRYAEGVPVTSGSKDLVEQNLRLVLLDTLCKSKLGLLRQKLNGRRHTWEGCSAAS